MSVNWKLELEKKNDLKNHQNSSIKSKWHQKRVVITIWCLESWIINYNFFNPHKTMTAKMYYHRKKRLSIWDILGHLDSVEIQQTGLRNCTSPSLLTMPFVDCLQPFQTSWELPAREGVQLPSKNSWRLERIYRFQNCGVLCHRKNKSVSRWQKCIDSKGFHFD